MRKLIIIFFLLPFVSFGQDIDYSQYLPKVAWSTKLENVTYVNQDTFTVNVSPLDTREPGARPLMYGNYIVDNKGFRYEIVDTTNAPELTVIDAFGVDYAPANNKTGYVYQSSGDGESHSLPTFIYDKLQTSAFAYGYNLDLNILWKQLSSGQDDEFNYIDFDTTLTNVERKRARLYYDKERDNLVFYDANKDVSLDIGKELWIDVYNPSIDTIFNGKCIVFQGNGGSHPSVKLAQANLPMNISSRIGLATEDILPYTYGRMTIVGDVRDYDTRGMTTGQKLFISSTTEGDLTTSRPEFPNYRILVATVDSVGEFGSVNVNVIGTPSDITGNITNGAFNEDFDFKITSDGTTVTGTLTDDEGNGYLTTKFSDGLDTINLPASISIPQGTSTNPQFSYVYLEKSTKKLAVSTSYWSELEHIPVATIVIRTAAQVQVAGAIRNQNVNNHLASSNGMGGLDHIRKRIRILYCVYESGCDITVNADDFTTTSGSAWQMHLQPFDAHSLSLDGAYVVNDFTAPYTVVNSLSEMLEDASGDNLKNKEYSIVVWGVQNSTDAPDQLMINLPTSTYNSVTDAINDADGYTNYSIPRNFRGVGFLLYRLTFSNSNGTWTIEDTEDLRGTIPSNVAGGGTGGAGGVESFLQLLDSPSSYVGAGGNLVSVSSSETALEFTPKSSVLLTELDSSGFELTASQITDFDSEVSNNTTVVANTAKTSANNATITFQGSAVSGTPETITLNQTANKTITINDTQAASQTLSKSGTDVTLSDGGGTVSIADNDNSSTNEIQDISGISTNASDIDDLEAEQLVQDAAINLNTVKRSYPIGDENKLKGIEAGAEVNTINSGDNVSLLVNDVPYLVNSDLGGYLPLTGGTLTGALNGTTSNLSGSLTTGGNIWAGGSNNNSFRFYTNFSGGNAGFDVYNSTGTLTFTHNGNGGHTYSLGNITASGDVSGANLSGTNTGDQTIPTILPTSSTWQDVVDNAGSSVASITNAANIGGLRVDGDVKTSAGVGMEVYYNAANLTTFINSYDRGVTNTFHPLQFGASEFTFKVGDVVVDNNISALNLSGTNTGDQTIPTILPTSSTWQDVVDNNPSATASITNATNVGGLRVGGSTKVSNGVGTEMYYNASNLTTFINSYDRGVTNTFHPLQFGASEYNFNVGDVNIEESLTAGGDVSVSGNTTISGDLSASELQINGTNINIAGTLGNVAYLNQDNTFIGDLSAVDINASGDVTISGSNKYLYINTTNDLAGTYFKNNSTTKGGIWHSTTNNILGVSSSDPIEIWSGNTSKVVFNTNGSVKFNNYGSGSNTGTVAKYAAFDASGNLIESDGTSGSSLWTDNNTYIYPTSGSDIRVIGTSPKVQIENTSGDTWEMYGISDSYAITNVTDDDTYLLLGDNEVLIKEQAVFESSTVMPINRLTGSATIVLDVDDYSIIHDGTSSQIWMPPSPENGRIIIVLNLSTTDLYMKNSAGTSINYVGVGGTSGVISANTKMTLQYNTINSTWYQIQ